MRSVPEAVALRARVSFSPPERRLVAYDRDGNVVHEMDGVPWVSLDVHVEAELDDGRRVFSTPEPRWALGGPLEDPDQDLEDRVRGLIFGGPRFPPGNRRTEPPQLVDELRAHGVETTIETLQRLPLTLDLADDLEARLARE